MIHNYAIYRCDFTKGERTLAAVIPDANVNIADHAARQLEAELPQGERGLFVFVRQILPPGIVQFKRCGHCRQYKPHSHFYRETHHKGGLTPNCKICHQTHNRASKRRHADRVTADRKRTNDRYSLGAARAGLTHRQFRALPTEQRLQLLAEIPNRGVTYKCPICRGTGSFRALTRGKHGHFQGVIQPCHRCQPTE